VDDPRSIPAAGATIVAAEDVPEDGVAIESAAVEAGGTEAAVAIEGVAAEVRAGEGAVAAAPVACACGAETPGAVHVTLDPPPGRSDE
jgi:hypothetical protein